MSLPSTELARRGASTFGSVALAQRGDTIAAVHALADTVYLFDFNGKAVGIVALPFVEAPAEAREMSSAASGPELMSAFAGVRRNAGLFWLEDGSFVIVTARQQLDRSITWGVMHASRSGSPLFESSRTPRLLTVFDSTFYFRDPDALEPNKLWSLTNGLLHGSLTRASRTYRYFS